jgi:hypothetical protein
MEHLESRMFETRPWPSLEVSGGGVIGVVASRPEERPPFSLVGLGFGEVG